MTTIFERLIARDHPNLRLYEHPMYGVALFEDEILTSSLIRNSNENYIAFGAKRFFHRLPASKISWLGSSERFASTSTSLRIWRVGEDRPILKLSPKTSGQVSSPLTSFDWSSQTNRIATCSSDTTIAVWDVERGKLETRMIAHDKAVFDVAFSTNEFLFASVSDDCSMRLFDTRDLNHSTIVFEGSNPLLRLAWEQTGSNTIAAVASEMKEILFFDMRKLGAVPHKTVPLSACANAIAWNKACLVAALSDGSVVTIDSLTINSSQAFPTPAINICCHKGKTAIVLENKSVGLINL